MFGVHLTNPNPNPNPLDAVEAEALLSARILLREREGADALMTDEVRQG